MISQKSKENNDKAGQLLGVLIFYQMLQATTPAIEVANTSQDVFRKRTSLRARRFKRPWLYPVNSGQ